MPLPNRSSHDSLFLGVLASVIVMAGAVWAGNDLIQGSRAKAESWGERRAIEGLGDLRDQSGVGLTQEQMKGHATVVAFFFTRCTQTCPVVMQALQKLQGDLAGSGVKIVSISVEGSHDTSSVLDAYAKKLNAGGDWRFLTGDPAAIRRLARLSFFAGVEENKAEPIGKHITHSSRLYLVNRSGQISGLFELAKPRDPENPDAGFVVDEAALRRLKLAALDAQHETWLGLADLPHVNAVLNAACAVLLVVGFAFIRSRMPAAHAVTMISAFLVSSLFLASYLIYHRYAGETRFTGSGPIRVFYLSLLLSHVGLAIVTVPLVLITLWKAARTNFAGHKRIARWTLPIWLYVSVSGLAVYLFLYQLFPG